MKKLFLSALIAVAAIGGARAFPIYDYNGNYLGDCVVRPPSPDCSLGLGTYRDAEGNLYTAEDLEGLDWEPAQ